MSSPTQNHITILGAGVTGLQTALTLLTSPSPPLITIIAQHTPGDSHPSYTSPWAGGHWRSHAGPSPQDELPREWDARTYRYWREILENGDGMPGSEGESIGERERRMGLGVRTSLNFWGEHTEETSPSDGSGLWWSKPEVVRDCHVLNSDELASQGTGKEGGDLVFGVRYESVTINVPRYLQYLHERVVRLGARIVKTQFNTSQGLEGIIISIKAILTSHNLPPTNIVINATGLNARLFASTSEQENLYPIRGQTILVKGEAHTARTITHFGLEDEVAYVIPRPASGTTILGGCKQSGNSSSEIDLKLSKRILQRIQDFKLADELLVELDGGKGFEVISTQVGFRPGRKGGPRVELEGGNGKVEGIWVIHSYGHAGAGYQNSVGCAERVASIVRELGVEARPHL